MKKVFLIVGIVIFVGVFVTSFAMLMNYNENTTNFSLPPEEKNYIKYTVNKGEITEELVIDGVVRGTDNSVKTFSIAKNSNLILIMKIGQEIKINDVIYKKNNISQKSEFNGLILSIDEEPDIITVTYLDFKDTNIEILVSQKNQDKIIKANNILIKSQDEEFEGTLSFLSSSYIEDNQLLPIGLQYKGNLMINTKVKVLVYGETKTDVFCVKKEALVLENKKYYLQFLDKNQNVTKIEVTTGIEDAEGYVEIYASDIKENMEVVKEFSLEDNDE